MVRMAMKEAKPNAQHNICLRKKAISVLSTNADVGPSAVLRRGYCSAQAFC
jgi:hypothetical protein